MRPGEHNTWNEMSPRWLIISLFNDASLTAHVIQRRILGWFVNNELEGILKEKAGVCFIQVFSLQEMGKTITNLRSWVSSGSIVSGYGLDDRAIGVRSPAGAKDFSSILCVQTGSGAHPASSSMGTEDPFPGAKARSGRDADHSPPSSAEVLNE
jgi:hypothetical protein